MASLALIAWFSFKIFIQLSPTRYPHSITSEASGATGFTLAQCVVIMAFIKHTHCNPEEQARKDRFMF
jgi:hypothetical protein